MKRERADEITRMVIYGNLSMMPSTAISDDAFNVGRMVGKMQERLETELSKEVQDEDLDAKVKEDMCDNYCKYPIMNMDESDLEAVCETCSLNNMYGREKQ